MCSVSLRPSRDPLLDRIYPTPLLPLLTGAASRLETERNQRFEGYTPEEESEHEEWLDRLVAQARFSERAKRIDRRLATFGAAYRSLGFREIEIDDRVAWLLRSARVSSGLTQRDLARALGISQATLSRMERGTKPISLSQALAILSFLGRRLADLLDFALLGA